MDATILFADVSGSHKLIETAGNAVALDGGYSAIAVQLQRARLDRVLGDLLPDERVGASTQLSRMFGKLGGGDLGAGRQCSIDCGPGSFQGWRFRAIRAKMHRHHSGMRVNLGIIAIGTTGETMFDRILQLLTGGSALPATPGSNNAAASIHPSVRIGLDMAIPSREMGSFSS